MSETHDTSDTGDTAPIAGTNEMPTAETPTVTYAPAASDAHAPATTAPVKEPRSWSTRTLAVSAIAALVVGAGGGAALGAISNGQDSQGGPGGRGGFQRMNGEGVPGRGQGFPGGGPGQGRAGQGQPPGTNQQQGVMPQAPAAPSSQSSQTDPNDDDT